MVFEIRVYRYPVSLKRETVFMPVFFHLPVSTGIHSLILMQVRVAFKPHRYFYLHNDVLLPSDPGKILNGNLGLPINKKTATVRREKKS